MIAACPNCRIRYRLDAARLGAEGTRLRCSQCGAVFRVRLPAGHPQEPARQPAPARPQEKSLERGRLVLVAGAAAERCKATAERLGHWGLESVVVHDGVDAILTLQRTLPRAVVLDAKLPRMSGAEICELVKRNESLRATWVILVGSSAEGDPRSANDPYGADAYVERDELPGALPPILRGFGLPVQAVEEPRASAAAPAPAPEFEAAPRPAPAPRPQAVPEPRPRPAPAPPLARPEAPAPATPTIRPPAPATRGTPAPADEELEQEHAKAERLARIIVSDIVLYNEGKFAAAVQSGTVLEAMAAELQEGRQLFERRTDPRVRAGRDHLADELTRVARARGMP